MLSGGNRDQPLKRVDVKGRLQTETEGVIMADSSGSSGEEGLLAILEKQKQDLVVRYLKKHEEVETNRTLLDRIMSQLSNLILILSVDLQIVQANKAFYRVLDLQEEEDLDLRDITDSESYRCIKDLLATGEFEGVEMVLLGRDRSPVQVTLRGTSYVTESGRILHMLVASDRREFFEVMHRMQEVQDQLTHSGRLASLGEMAAGIGHELTQPLNTILLLARNSVKAMDHPSRNDKMIRDNLATIIDRVNHASSIIRSMKGFASKSRTQPTPVRIKVILLDVLSFLETQLQLSGVSVDLALDQRDFLVLAQEVKIEQVIFNLIQNSIQAMAATKSPLLRVKTYQHNETDPKTSTPLSYVSIAITDNGEGIVPEIRDKIFNPFFTTREVGTGMGLGLSIVERIVRGFGGNIDIKSEPGIATTFTINLPEHTITVGS